MDLEKEVEYRLARWVFANIYHEEKLTSGHIIGYLID